MRDGEQWKDGWTDDGATTDDGSAGDGAQDGAMNGGAVNGGAVNGGALLGDASLGGVMIGDGMIGDAAVDDGPPEEVRARWANAPSVRQRNSVRHEVLRLLDDLAPERQPPRGAPKPVARVEQHRSPRGCILQSVGSAVSVSWFPPLDSEMGLGELVVSVWRGTVSHPGSARRAPQGAELTLELTLRPIEVGPDAWRWRATNDAVYESRALAERCRDLLEGQIRSSTAAASA